VLLELQPLSVKTWAPWIALIFLLLLTWAVYHPGLAGGFVFDDFANLNALGATGRVDDWSTFLRYVTSGTADPTGRPLALLSFLLDARDWPADPRPFLRTNILLHLANAALLFLLLRQFGRRVQPDGDGFDIAPAGIASNSASAERGGQLFDSKKAVSKNSTAESPGGIARTARVAAHRNFSALLGTALWTLHPLLVSTTLYVVQREAMLVASFTLMGLLAWGHGRNLITRSPRAGAAWMIGGIGLGTLLAIGCKANGVLLPLLAWVVECTIYRDGTKTPLAKRLHWLLLVLPIIMLCGYLLSKLGQWAQPLEFRPWTISQRLLTEPRVLLEYLRLLVVPRVLSTGVYNDGYAWSTSPLHPLTTLPALLAVLALVILGFALRRRCPALALALLFFFAGHFLESTTIPLELYFEHRNYLPAMLLGWPLARGIVRWQSPPALRVAVALALLTMLGTTTWQRASLWADQPRMAGLWAAITPNSSRAIATQALFDIRGHRPDLAMKILSAPWLRRPYDLQLALNYVNAACLAQGPGPGTVSAVEAALRHAKEGDQLVYEWLGDILEAVQAGGCPRVDLNTVERWTRAALVNSHVASNRQRLQTLHAVLGRVALARGNSAEALREFQRGLDAWPTPDAAAQQSAWLAAAGYPAEGLALLDHYASIEPSYKQSHGWNMSSLHQWILNHEGYWPHEFAVLRSKMREELPERTEP
jgi:hypothetical protein